jgi:hypothetical protein
MLGRRWGLHEYYTVTPAKAACTFTHLGAAIYALAPNGGEGGTQCKALGG